MPSPHPRAAPRKPILNRVKPLTKSILIPFGLTAAASTTNAAIHKKMFGSEFIKLIISNEELEDIMKIIKSLEGCGLLIKGVSETIKYGVKEQNGRSLGILLGTLGASLLGNLLSSKSTIRGGQLERVKEQ